MGDEEDDVDPELQEIEAMIAKAQGGAQQDASIIASLQKEEDDAVSADCAAQQEFRQRSASVDSEESDSLPPPASEAEVEEARQIVQRAQREVEERNKMKAQMKGASKEDLQAMI